MSNEVIFSKKFKPLFSLLSNERDENGKLKHLPKVDTVIMTGGRLSSKSFTCGIFSAIALVDYHWNVLYTRYTNASIVDSVKPEVSSKLELLGFENIVKDTNTHIEYGDNRIAFKGIKTGSKSQTANLKSLSGFNCFVNDEAEELPDFDTFKKIFYSIRSHELRNLTILILNPTTKNHWIYEEFFINRGIDDGFNGVKENVMYIHTSYLDVERKFIPDNIYNDYQRMKKDDPKAYDNIIKGGWIDEVEGQLLPQSKLSFQDLSNLTPQDYVYSFSVGDPANTGGDNYSMMFIWVLAEGSNLKFAVKDVIYSQDGIEALTPRIIDRLQTNSIEDTFLEANGVGLAAYLQLKGKIENHTNLKPFTTKENKEVKILSNYEFIKKHFIFDSNYKDNEDYRKFISHLTAYNRNDDNKHKIDAIDNASMASKILKIKYKEILFQ